LKNSQKGKKVRGHYSIITVPQNTSPEKSKVLKILMAKLRIKR